MAKKPEKPGNVEPTAPSETARLLDLVDALDRQHRRLRRSMVALTLVALLAIGVATAAVLAPYNENIGFYLQRWLGRPRRIAVEQTVIEAERFALRTHDGKVRAALGARDDGGAGLDFFDDGGTPRAGLDLATDGRASLWFAEDDGKVVMSLDPRSLHLVGTDGAAFVTRTALVLADAAQKNRVTLALKADGAPNLVLADREGRAGALLDVPADGTRLGLFYDGAVRAGIGYGPGGAQLNLYAEDGKDHATMSLTKDGSTGLVFHDEDGKQRVALGVLPNSASGLSLFDKGGAHRAALSVVPDGSPRLELFDPGGTRRANLALSSEGLPALQLEDKGQPRAVLGASSDGKRKGSSPASLLLFDKDGSVVFQAPIY